MRGKKIEAAPVIEGQLRRNPYALRQLIFIIIAERFSSNFEAAAEEFNRHISPESIGKRHRENFDKNTLYRIVCDKMHIKYHHLEAISNYLGVPIFVILIVTRVYWANQKSDHKEIENVKEILNLVLNNIASYNYDIQSVFDLSTEIASDKLFKEAAFDLR